MAYKKVLKLLVYLLFAVLVLMPLFVIFMLAISKTWNYPSLWPKWVDWGYYFRFLVTNTEIQSSLLASMELAVGTVVLTILIAYPTAMALSYYDFRGKKLLNILVYLPMIIPGIAVLTNMDFIMIKYGLNGSFFGVVSAHTLFCLPYAIKLLYDNLILWKDKYEVASRNLGATPLQTFFKVTIPLNKNGLQGAVMMSYIVSMTQYLGTLLIGDGNYITLSVRMFPFTTEGKYRIAAVYGITFMLVTLIPLYLIDIWVTHKGRKPA
ncbi:ABC transporter permease [Companilactobacillus kedongensis]|uniref:ABC transporter permease n=1 Tax=Companilactobacillus kedongensis TaxID=2486004 RepID=UPI000F7962A5|nr:ABC transporter permease subunit [Companilactobacillus kedongensis]